MSTAEAVKFSAILLNFNHSRFVLTALNAAAEQTQAFDEIIVIDDASTDDSVTVLQDRLQTIPQARLLQNPKNLGVIGSANLALQQATGDFVFFMSADDDYDRHIVEWCRQALALDPDVAMISGNTRILDVRANRERIFTLPFAPVLQSYGPADIRSVAQHRAFTFIIGANVMRRDAVFAAGGYLPQLHWHCDWFLYLVIASRARFAVVPQTFARVRQAGSQYSNACFYWRRQKPVIRAFIEILQQNYAREYEFFRSCALLPTYDVQALMFLAFDPKLRDYLTPLLCWRLLTYKPLRFVSKLCPDNARTQLRKWIRV